MEVGVIDDAMTFVDGVQGNLLPWEGMVCEVIVGCDSLPMEGNINDWSPVQYLLNHCCEVESRTSLKP